MSLGTATDLPDANAAFSAAGHQKRSAILVIDMQHYFLETIEQRENLIASIDRFNEFYRGKAPIYLVTSVLGQDFLDPEIIKQSEICVERLPQARMLEKSASSGFQYGKHGDLHHMLGQDGIDHLYIVGINRSICVAETAIDARKLGYTVDIVYDLTADGQNILRNKDVELMTAQRAAEHGIGWISSENLIAGIGPSFAPTSPAVSAVSIAPR